MKASFHLLRRGILLGALILCVTTCAGAQPPRPLTQTDKTPPFELHSGFWINLHHYLYEQALLRRRAAGSGQMSASGTGANSMNGITEPQQRVWDSAVDYYVNTMVKRDLVFDKELVAINDRLAELERAANLSRSGLNADLVRVLESVAPVYRERWWPAHDRANQFWIAVITPMLKQFSRPLVEQLTNAFRARWPTAPIRLDVVVYANWAGAYTTFDTANRVHTTISSTDARCQGFAALETVFHEASHSMVDPRTGAIAEAIARECRARNKPVPRDLWHAVLFYTVGEIVRRNLSEYGVSDYKPYAYLNGLYARGWQDFQRALELDWQPYLDGKADFDGAMSRLIEAL